MNMIEKVARAISTVDEVSQDDYKWEDFNENLKSYYIDMAKEAIQAMRKPTEEMIDYAHLYCSVASSNVKDCWQIMIDKALKE